MLLIEKPNPSLGLNGYLIPCQEAGPVLLQMSGSTEFWMVAFSSQERLEQFCEAFQVTCEKVQQIINDATFLVGLRETGYRLAVDSYRSLVGTVHFTEVELFQEAQPN